MEANHLNVTGIGPWAFDACSLAPTQAALHAGCTAAELASAGILRVLARLGRSRAA